MVEFAVVAPIFFLFVFGILEYGRYVMTLQIVTNAAREGARFAVVTTNDNSANPTRDVQNYVNEYMAAQGVQLSSPGGGAFDPTVDVWVYTADSTNLQPVYVNNNGSQQICQACVPVNAAGADVLWSSVTYDSKGNPQPWLIAPYTNAAYNQTISVVIVGTYTPALPTFLFMGNTIPVSAQAIMYSEAN